MSRLATIGIALCAVCVATLVGCGSGTRVRTVVPSTGQQPRVIVNERAFAYYSSAVFAEYEGLYQDAITYYQQALDHAPGNSEILYSLAGLLYKLRQPQVALDNALKIFYRDADTYQLIGDCYRVLGDHTQAEEAYRKAVMLDDDALQAHYYVAVYAAQRNDLDDAVKHFREVARINPSPQVFNEIGRLSGASGKTEEAMRAYRESIELDPTESNAEAYVSLASLQRTANDSTGAERTILSAAEANPNNAAFRLYLSEMYAAYGDTVKAVDNVRWLRENADSSSALLDRIGQISFRLNQLDLADSIFSQEMDLVPESALGNYYRGRIAFIRNRPAEAKQFFTRLTEVADSVPDGYINLGLVYLSEDSTDKAIEVLEKGVQRSTDGREDAQFYLATALGRAKRFAEVIGIASALTSMHPDEIRYLFMLGSALERTKAYDSAAVVFERILSLDPNHAQTLNYLGYMWADIGVNLQESLEMIEKALKLDANNGAYLDSYGWALYRLGRFEDASKQIEKAIAFGEESDPVIFEHLGDVYQSLGRLDEAKAQWRKALSMDPDNTELKEKLAR